MRAQADGGVQGRGAVVKKVERPDIDGAAGQIDSGRRRRGETHAADYSQSSRSAFIGSTRAARRAGASAAANATAPRIAEATTNVTGSRGAMSKTRAAMTRASASEPARPAAIPTTVTAAAGPRTVASTWDTRAP